MNTDKAYIFGLIIGGGIEGDSEDVFTIKLPYKRWGSYDTNVKRASQISRDIMGFLSPLFKSIYSINISFEAYTGGDWVILCEGDIDSLRADLVTYGIYRIGELKKDISIKTLLANFADDNTKRRFIAGIADTIGSMAKSHRRFSDDKQIVSFELSGFNFELVLDLCGLLHSINCIPDQVTWNHPNFHTPENPYHTQWNKGFKIRVLLDQYNKFGAFAFKTKATALQENVQLQTVTNVAIPCKERNVRSKAKSFHISENDIRFPEIIRGGHYIHYHHVCAVLGCQYAPYESVKSTFQDVGKLIIPFPILLKDSLFNIQNIISNEAILSDRTYNSLSVKVSVIYSSFVANKKSLYLGNGTTTGYPLAKILQGIAYILASPSEIKGKRPSGSYEDIIKRYLVADGDVSVTFEIPDILTPLLISSNGKGALIAAYNPEVYKKTVSISPENEFKLTVRKLKVEDFQN